MTVVMVSPYLLEPGKSLLAIRLASLSCKLDAVTEVIPLSDKPDFEEIAAPLSCVSSPVSPKQSAGSKNNIYS